MRSVRTIWRASAANLSSKIPECPLVTVTVFFFYDWVISLDQEVSQIYTQRPENSSDEACLQRLSISGKDGGLLGVPSSISPIGE